MENLTIFFLAMKDGPETRREYLNYYQKSVNKTANIMFIRSFVIGVN